MAAKGKKGPAFERKMCRELSRWATDGERADVFWRSAMSGGRATVAARANRGAAYDRQAGDVSATHPAGHPLLDVFVVELKHYKKLRFDLWVYGNENRADTFWREPVDVALDAEREPFIVLKGNRYKELLLVSAHVAGWFEYEHGIWITTTWPWLEHRGVVPHACLLEEVLAHVPYSALAELK